MRCIHKIQFSHLTKGVVIFSRWSSISSEIKLSTFSKVPVGGELVIGKPMLKKSEQKRDKQ